MDIALHPKTGKSMGLALVKYTIQSSARRAAEQCNEAFILGTRITVEIDEDGANSLNSPPMFFSHRVSFVSFFQKSFMKSGTRR